jgi:hypothetical protein
MAFLDCGKLFSRRQRSPTKRRAEPPSEKQLPVSRPPTVQKARQAPRLRYNRPHFYFKRDPEVDMVSFFPTLKWPSQC